MRVLAIDTSSKIGSVAIADGARILEHRLLDASAHHGASLAPTVASLAIDFSKLDAYAVTIGPGSFTGLRIALAFLKGLALVHARPVIAVSTLEVIARAVFDHHPGLALALPMLDARRNEDYAGLFAQGADGLQVRGELPEASHPIARLPERLGALASACVAAGDGVALPHPQPLWTVADRDLWTPDARVLARIAGERRSGVDAADLEPRYLQLAPGET